MIGDKSSYKETPCIDSPTDRCPGIYSYLSGAVRLLLSRNTGNLKIHFIGKLNYRGLVKRALLFRDVSRKSWYLARDNAVRFFDSLQIWHPPWAAENFRIGQVPTASFHPILRMYKRKTGRASEPGSNCPHPLPCLRRQTIWGPSGVPSFKLVYNYAAAGICGGAASCATTPLTNYCYGR
jgi:hypothetical protein